MKRICVILILSFLAACSSANKQVPETSASVNSPPQQGGVGVLNLVGLCEHENALTGSEISNVVNLRSLRELLSLWSRQCGVTGVNPCIDSSRVSKYNRRMQSMNEKLIGKRPHFKPSSAYTDFPKLLNEQLVDATPASELEAISKSPYSIDESRIYFLRLKSVACVKIFTHLTTQAN